MPSDLAEFDGECFVASSRNLVPVEFYTLRADFGFTRAEGSANSYSLSLKVIGIG